MRTQQHLYYNDETGMIDRAVKAYLARGNADTSLKQPNRYATERVGNMIYIRTGYELLATYRVVGDSVKFVSTAELREGG